MVRVILMIDMAIFIYIHLIHLKVNIKMEKGMEKEKNFIRIKNKI